MISPEQLVAQLAAIMRSPIANLASVVQGVTASIRPATTEQPLARFNGLPGQAQVWNVAITPIPPDRYALDQPIRGANPWTQARLRWSVGNALAEAIVDLHAGTTIQLAFDTLEVWVLYNPPEVFTANDPNPVEWRCQISSAIGSVPAALPTRTIQGGGDATIAIPMWARSVTPMLPSTAPIAWTLNFRDPLGVNIGSVYGIPGAVQPPPTIDIPQGAAFCELVGGPNIRWTLIFRLSL